jgi:hypothetical protein
MSMLIFTAYGLSATLSRFTNGNYPRERLDPPTISRSQNGTPLRRGTSYEAPHLWQVAAIVDATTALALQSIHDLYQLSPGAIVLDDLIRPYTEPGPRSRALATGAPAASVVGSNVRYFARFNAEFQGALAVVEKGRWFEVSCQLVETTKVAA